MITDSDNKKKTEARPREKMEKDHEKENVNPFILVRLY